jgi:hypothetical protein
MIPTPVFVAGAVVLTFGTVGGAVLGGGWILRRLRGRRAGHG